MTPRIPGYLPLLLTLSLGIAPLGVTAAAGRGPATTATPCSWVAAHFLPYEDSGAHYWQTNVRADPSLSLTVTGVYPAARYASLQAYTASGSFLTGLPDVAFPPDPGAVNPFAAGGLRGTGSYTLHVVFGPAPTTPLSGTFYVDVPASTTVALLYRIYLPDTGATPQGNVALPAVTAQAGGVPSPCPTASAAASRAHPATAGVSVSRPRAATPPGFTRQGEGTVYANGDVAYLATILWPGSLYVIRFQAPTTPRTLAGAPFDPTTQLRYWSLCTYSPNQTPSQCVADEQAPASANGQVTVALGPWWARPSNATAAQGVTWISLNWFVVPYTILLRHMLPAPGFTASAFAVPYGAAPAPSMGTYAPTVVQCTTAQFQTNQCSG